MAAVIFHPSDISYVPRHFVSFLISFHNKTLLLCHCPSASLHNLPTIPCFVDPHFFALVHCILLLLSTAHQFCPYCSNGWWRARSSLPRPGRKLIPRLLRLVFVLPVGPALYHKSQTTAPLPCRSLGAPHPLAASLPKVFKEPSIAVVTELSILQSQTREVPSLLLL